ncbi:MAG: tetratricopeptide repeat protein [Bacteroidales bacterium]|nr:tetratricopeptide repeat protein [Bacteroidales bacterium]
MPIWSAEIKELEKLYESIKGRFPEVEKELGKLIKADDENMIFLYSRRCLEVIITDLCECELKRPRKTEPLKGIIDKLQHEEKIPSHIITSMHNLNSLSTYGAHPKDFDSEQIKLVLVNLDIIIKWYLKYKDTKTILKAEEIKDDIKAPLNSTGQFQKPKKKLILLLSGLTLVVAIVVVALFVFDIIGGERQIKELEKSIAVLRLDYLSENPDKEYLADGVLDAITGHLSMIEGLRVMPRTSVEQYRENKKSAKEIGEELNVSYLIEGSFQMVDDQVKLIIQLVVAEGGDHIFFKEYDREYKDILAVQSEVAQTIAREIGIAITPEVIKRIEKVPTNSLTAYNLYLKANNYLKKYENTRDLSFYYTSVNLFKDALIEDSTFAKAYTGLAAAYYSRNYFKTYFEQDFLDSCLVLINKAISFDNQLDEAYYLKGIYYQGNGQLQEAMNNFDKALKINPNYYLAYVAKGGKWISIDFVESITNYQKALNLIGVEERSPLLKDLALIYVDIGFFDKARNYYMEALKLDGDSADYFYNLAYLEFTAENLENAVFLFEKVSKIDSTISLPLEFYSFARQDHKAYMAAVKKIELLNKSGELPLHYSHRIGYAFWKAGKFKEADYYFKEQIKYGTESIKLGREMSSQKSSQYDLAAVYAFLGDKTKAYQYLDDFNTLNIYPKWWISYAKYDNMFESIRNEVRFQKILQNMEAKYQAEHERVRKWLEENDML